MEGRKHLVDWLRDAHAMEQQAESLLKRQAERLNNYVEMRRRIEQHIEETRSQAQRIEECINRVDGDTSAMKDIGGKISANMSALFNAAAEDEVVKNTIGSYAFEHFEIASYRSLIAAAEAVGDQYIARVCREILQEEEAMASWLEEHLPETTQMFLKRDEIDAPAKR